MTHWHMWHVSFMRVTWLIYACDMSQLCVWHDSSDVYNAPTLWRVHMCDLTTHQTDRVWHEWLTYVTWLTYMCDVTWLVRSQRTPTSWLVHMCDLTWSDESRHVTHVNESCHICQWLMSHVMSLIYLHVWLDALKYGTWLIYACDLPHPCVTWLIVTCDMTHSCAWSASSDGYSTPTSWLMHMCDMTWRISTCDMSDWHMRLIYMCDMIDTCDMTHQAFTAHPHHDSISGRMVGWSWAQNPLSNTLSLTIVEWYTYEYVMSHPWTSHVTRLHEACHMYEWVELHIWMRHATSMEERRRERWIRCRRPSVSHSLNGIHMNMSCHTYEWGMLHVWMRHVTRMNELSYTYECAMLHAMRHATLHVWTRHLSRMHCRIPWVSHSLNGTHMSMSCHIYEWVVLHVWMRHVTRMNEACQTYDWVELQVWMRHATRMNETLAQNAQLNTSSFALVEWYAYEYFMSHLWMSHVTRLNEACWIPLVSHSLNGIHMNESRHTYKWVTLHIWIRHVTAMQGRWCHTHECVMPHILKSRGCSMHVEYLLWGGYHE